MNFGRFLSIFLLAAASCIQVHAETTAGENLSPPPAIQAQPEARWGQIQDDWPYHDESALLFLNRSQRCELKLQISFINRWKRQQQNFRPPREGIWLNNPEHYNRVDIQIKCGSDYPIASSHPIQFDVHNHANANTQEYLNEILETYKNNFLAANFILESPAGCGYPDRDPCVFTKQDSN